MGDMLFSLLRSRVEVGRTSRCFAVEDSKDFCFSDLPQALDFIRR